MTNPALRRLRRLSRLRDLTERHEKSVAYGAVEPRPAPDFRGC